MHQLPLPDWNALLLGAFLRGFLPVLVLLAAVCIAQWFLYRWKLHRRAQSGIDDIDRMTGREFERYLEALFTKLGYKVELTPYVGDYGADLVVRKEGAKTVVQAKRRKGRVGPKAIGEVLRAKGNYRCSAAVVVTNSSFTRQAVQEARANGIELWDRDALICRLLSIKKSNESRFRGTDSPVRPSKEIEARSLPSVSRAVDPAGIPPLSGGPTGAVSGDTSAGICLICGKAVSEKVKQYCLDHPHKFGGHIYCFDHQRRRSSG